MARVRGTPSRHSGDIRARPGQRARPAPEAEGAPPKRGPRVTADRWTYWDRLGDIMGRAPRAMLAIAMAIALAATASGCGLSFFFPVVEESTPIPEEVDAALEPYYTQVLSWDQCGEFLCATATGTPRLGGPGGRGDRARAHPPAREAGEGRLPPRQPGRAGRFRVRLRGRLHRLRGDGCRAGPLRHRGLRSARRRTVERGDLLRAGRDGPAAVRASRGPPAAATSGSPARTSSPTRSARRASRAPAHCSRTSTR